VVRRPPPRRRNARDRRRFWTRAAPLVGIAAVAFAVGVVTSQGPDRAERRLVSDYLRAWSHNDFARMYGMLDASSRARTSESEFASGYRAAGAIATVQSVVPGRIGKRRGNLVPVRVRVVTRLFGALARTLEVPLDGTGSGAHIRFSDRLLFPGLRPGESLTRQTTMAPRASILARDGTPLAQGADRTSPIPAVAGQIAGTLGPIPAAAVTTYEQQGYPPDAKVGLDGLERIFQNRLAGTPGGTLLAGSRVLASVAPLPGLAVTTTIDPRLEQAAIAAMGGRYAGIVAMDPRTGQLLALAGIAFSALQPPGSTFKIITATGALEAGIVKLTDTFPYATQALVGGVPLQNANGESCGGTFLQAFANSCNSVFAPLGAKLGGAKLVDVAQRFGFNQQPSIAGAAESTIPSADQIGDALAVGSSAIGQGLVQTTPLEMADVAATIAMHGKRPIPTLQYGAEPKFVRVTSRHIARLVERLMIAVVSFGTGTAAQIPGVLIAGKTGTAELRNTVVTPATTTTTPGSPPPNSPLNTDAWFVGYGPVGHPRIVVGALFPANGAGGSTAAPAVHDVLAAALQH
jgi:peptidoglycan glycosyltransferase